MWSEILDELPEEDRFSGYPAQDTPQFPTYRDYPSLKDTGGLPYKVPIPLLGRAERTPRVILGKTVEDIPGMVKPGTIDLTDPFLSTKDSFYIEDNGQHVVLPGQFGRELALQQYRKTGTNLGVFKDEKSADEYTQHLSTYQDLSSPQPYGLEVAGEDKSGQPIRGKTGRKDAGFLSLQQDMEKEGFGKAKIEPEPQESLRAKDRQVGLVTPGNIDLDNLTPVPTDGSEGDMDTLAPIVITDQKKKQSVLIPTIIDGREFPIKDAIRDYQKTGKHLGVFKDEIAADEYKRQLLDRQNQFYGLASNIPTQYADPTGGGGRPGELAPGNLAPEPGSRQAAATANRQLLIDAIDDTEKQGYKVPHGIGTPDEPEGDRGPTRDMENLVEMLGKMEKDTKDPQKAAEIAQKRAFWEEKIRMEGMSQGAEDAAQLPFNTYPPQSDVPDVVSNRGLLASTAKGIPIPPPSEEESDRQIRAEQLDKEPEIRQAEPNLGPHNTQVLDAAPIDPNRDIPIFDPSEAKLVDEKDVPLSERINPADASVTPVGPQVMDLVKGYEGWDTGQWDSKQYSTGYGTRAKYPGEKIDKPEAERRLEEELTQSANSVDQAIGKSGIKLDENQRNALISFDYNTGSGASLISTSRSPEEIRNRMLQYVHADGKVLPALVERRQDEARLFGGDAPSVGPDQAPSDTTSAFGRMAGISKMPESFSTQHAYDSAEAAKENALKALEGFEGSLQGSSAALSKYVAKPLFGGIQNAIHALAPDSALSKYTAGLYDQFNKFAAEETGAAAAEKLTPKAGESTMSEISRGVGQVIGDMAQIIPTAGAGTGLRAAVKAPEIGQAVVEAPTVFNIIKQQIPNLGRSAESLAIPALRSGMQAQDMAQRMGASPADQNLAFTKAALLTMGSAMLPLGVESNAANMFARFVERAVKAAPLGVATGAAVQGAENILSPGEARPFDPKQLTINAVPIALLAGALGQHIKARAQGPIARQAFPKTETQTMPGGEVKFAPPETPAPKEAPPKPKVRAAPTFQELENELKKLWPESYEKNLNPLKATGVWGKNLKSEFEKLPQERQDQIDKWFDDNQDAISHALTRKHVDGRLEEMRDTAGTPKQFAFQVIDAIRDFPEHKDYIISKAREIVKERGWTPEELKTAIQKELVAIYGRDAPQMLESFFPSKEPASAAATPGVQAALPGIPPKEAPTGEERFAPGAPRGPLAIPEQPPAIPPGPPSRIAPPPIPNQTGMPRIRPMLGRLRKFPFFEFDLNRTMQGTAEIMEKSGFPQLGQAIRNHFDQFRVYQAMTGFPIRQWAKGVPRGEIKIAQEEFKNYWQSVDERWQFAGEQPLQLPGGARQLPGGAPPAPDIPSQEIYNAASPKGKELIDLWKKLAGQTGDIALKNKLEVYDHDKGTWRPFRKIGGDQFFPRRISPKWLEIMSKPDQYPTEMADLRREILAKGYVNQLSEVDGYLSRALKEHTPDDLSPLEHGRTSPLPTRVYDYSFDTALNYLRNWSYDMARIEAYGQKKFGADEFTKAQGMTHDTYSKDYIKHVQDIAYRKINKGAWVKPINVATSFATVNMLGNVRSSMRNLIGGILYNAQYNGVMRGASALLSVHKAAAEIENAYEKGILQDNMHNLQQDVHQGRGKLVEGVLKTTGYQKVEEWTRGMNLMAARSFLRNAIKENQKNPNSWKTVQNLARIQRTGGIDPQALLREGGVGPITDRFLRQNVSMIQGGYALDQTPAFANTPQGRLTLQFSKWGTQAADTFIKNVANPAVQALSGGMVGKKETVQVPDGQGGYRPVQVPGNILPAAKLLLLSTAAGLGQKELEHFLLGIEDKEASFAEILSRLNQGDSKAFGDLIHKVWMANMSVGTAGIIGNASQMYTDVTQRSRFKDITAPPGLAMPKAVGEFLNDVISQGRITARDIDQTIAKINSGYRTGQQLAAQLNAWGGDIVALKAVTNRQEVSWLRSVTRRYDNVLGVDQPVFAPGSVGKNPLTPFTADLKEALLMGDQGRAADLLDEHLDPLSPSQQKVEMERIKQSVRGSHPIRVGGGTGQAMQSNFLDWSEENLPIKDQLKIVEIAERYEDTAVGLKLMKPNEATTRDRAKALKRIEDKVAVREGQ